MSQKSDERKKVYYDNLTKAYKAGYLSFVFKQGVLQFGLPFSIVMYIVDVGMVLDLFSLILWLAIGMVFGGFLFGTIMYYYVKKMVLKA